jgi:outer membrane protein W
MAISQGMPIMADDTWGLCKDCKWWQIEPDAAVNNLTLGLCVEEKLQPYSLRVSGISGCNRFKPGEPARAKGSGTAPPSAKPTR